MVDFSNHTNSLIKKNRHMKNLFIHYICLSIPFALIILSLRYLDTPVMSIVALYIWSLLYAPFLNGRRLFQKEVITKRRLVYTSDWKTFKAVYLSA